VSLTKTISRFVRPVVAVAKAIPATLSSPQSRGGWFPIVREAWAGAWQSNVEIEITDVLTHVTVYACISLIASDIGKLRIKLVQRDREGIWTETESPAFSPVLKKPNRYQNRIKFLENWVTSKLINGNTYALKQRDSRQIVTALYILDPNRVKVLIGSDGSVWYELNTDNLSGIKDPVIVPASEIIHDVMVPLYHPLVGVSPISACGLAAVQGLRIQENSTLFFQSGASPGGILTAEGVIKDADAERLSARWHANYGGANSGKVAVLGNGLKYQQLQMTAVDAQLIDQLKWTAESVAAAFHVPYYKVGGPYPSYNNVEALDQQYYSQCLQTQIESIELCLDEGLGLDTAKDGIQYGTELDLDALLRMDTSTRMKAAGDALIGGLTPDEVRKKYHDIGSVPGGDQVFLQRQNWPLGVLGSDSPLLMPAPVVQPPAPPEPDDEPDDEPTEMSADAMVLRSMTEGYLLEGAAHV
jgi:HK97 family phage portal protein